MHWTPVCNYRETVIYPRAPKAQEVRMCYSKAKESLMGRVTFVNQDKLDTAAKYEGEETPPASAAFEYYASLGVRRSLPPVVEHFNLPYSVIKNWSSRYRWPMRAIIRDRLEAEAAAEARVAAVATMKARFIEAGTELADLGAAHLKRKAQIRGRGGLSDVVAAQMIQIGTKLELRGYDLPEAITRSELTGKDGNAIEIEEVTEARERLVRMLERRTIEGEFKALPEEGPPDEVDEADSSLNEQNE